MVDATLAAFVSTHCSNAFERERQPPVVIVRTHLKSTFELIPPTRARCPEVPASFCCLLLFLLVSSHIEYLQRFLFFNYYCRFPLPLWVFEKNCGVLVVNTPTARHPHGATSYKSSFADSLKCVIRSSYAGHVSCTKTVCRHLRNRKQRCFQHG